MEPTAPDIAKARAEHEEILILLGRLEAALAQPAPPPGLAELRGELAQAIGAHLRHEDWVIYPWLLTHASEAIASSARGLFAEMLDFAAAHVQRWDAAAVDADWEGFRAAALPLLAKLRQRIDLEDSRLYRLLLDEPAGKAA